MKDAPLRIEPHREQTLLARGEGLSKYTQAATKLIPAEVVAAYLAGKAILLGDNSSSIVWWVGWTLVCLVFVIVLRAYATSDNTAGVPPERPAVFISALSFLVWVYSFGDVFQMLGLWSKLGSGLLLIVWSLASPLLFLGLTKVARPAKPKNPP